MQVGNNGAKKKQKYHFSIAGKRRPTEKENDLLKNQRQKS